MSKICFVINSFEIGGIERVIITLANLFSLNHRTELFVLKNFGTLRTEVSSRVMIYDAGNISASRFYISFRKYIRRNRGTLVITSIAPISIQAVLTNLLSLRPCKIIVTHHNMFDFENQFLGPFSFVVPTVIRIFYNLADRVVAVSENVRGRLRMVGVRNVVTIYNPIDFQELRRNSLVPPKNTKFSPPALLYVGRLAAIKNIGLIISAFKLFKSDMKGQGYRLYLLGDGPERKSLEALVLQEHLTEDVVFLGKVANPGSYIRVSACVLLSSFSEAMPMTVLESLALDVPIVTTPATGCLEIFERLGYGLYAKSFTDPEEFVSVMFRAITRGPLNLSDEMTKHFGAQEIYSEWEKIFRFLWNSEG